MGIACGVDIIEIDRIQRSMETTGSSFRDKVFTGREIEYCEGKKIVKYQSYAARFAAKEAVSKAFGTGIAQGVSLKDIEILNDEYGKPYVVLAGGAKEAYDRLRALDISLSLSHSQNYAVAYVVIITGENKG